jgi:hypothetical protein
MLLKRDHYKNWVAKTEIKLGDDRILTISTSKGRNSLRTMASVAKYERGFLSHMMFQDFNILVTESFPNRVTSKVVESQHLGVDNEDILAKAVRFYQGVK